MRVVLVNPPRSAFERDEIAPPLGLLKLADVAHRAGAEVGIEDFNLLYHLLPELRATFYEVAANRLLALGGDVYGFTSMAVDSHIALELGRRIKRERPNATIVIGGPHFSAIGGALRELCPWIDIVISGEGEGPFARFLDGRLGRSVAGRSADSTLADAPESYASISLPAYFAVNPTRTLNFEANRGCRYRCTFCYSSNFYGSARESAIDSVVAGLAALQDLGAKRVFLVGDNFVNDAAWVERVCAALEDARLDLTWHCYVTLPDLTDALADRMGRAGCRQVFMGVDVIGRTAEKAFHKAFARREGDLERKVKALLAAGIRPTCGFILCPPSHHASVDLDETLRVALRARIAGADVLFNALNLYAGTEAYQSEHGRFEADSLQVELLMDLPEVVHDNPFARSAPELFPFHARYTLAEEWQEFVGFCHTAHTLVNSFPESLATSSAGLAPAAIIKVVQGQVGNIMRFSAVDRRQVEQAAALDALGPDVAQHSRGVSAEVCGTDGLSLKLGHIAW